MEWELGHADADALREEARHTVRVRIDAPASPAEQQSVSAAHNVLPVPQPPTAAGRPKLGELCLVELQGELVLPTDPANEHNVAFLENPPRPKERLRGHGDVFSVGFILEDDGGKAAKSRALLKMGTLSIEGERSKNPSSSSLVVIDKKPRDATCDDDGDDPVGLKEGAQRRGRGSGKPSSMPASDVAAPPITHWRFSDEVTEETLLRALDADSDEEEHSGRYSGYDVLGTIGQRYFFKSKPMRVIGK